MSQILKLYAEMNTSGQRFIDEVFEGEEYAPACPQLTIFDVGGYEGEFSFYCLNFAKKIYAFEPDPRPWQIFRGRIGSYDLHDKIDLTERALSIKSGERVFHASGGGGSRLLGEGESGGDNIIKVPTVSLADYFKEKDIEQVDIFKIDVEHGEDEIFRAEEFPELSKKIKLIIGEHLEGVEEIFINLGYTKRQARGSNIIYERT